MPERCELCGKPINDAHPGVEYYVAKVKDTQKIMYRHVLPCPEED